MDVRVVRIQDTIAQLQKFNSLPAEVQKSIQFAQALVKDSESSRQVLGSCVFSALLYSDIWFVCITLLCIVHVTVFYVQSRQTATDHINSSLSSCASLLHRHPIIFYI